jgi:spermidine synthase
MKITRTKNGARLVQGGAVLSEILAAPGPTQSVFDVLAAAMATAQPSPMAVLGFAGGGLVAPLRAMGCTEAIDAVDLDLRGTQLFRELSQSWAGSVGIAEDDAVAWLRRGRSRYGVIVEDLSELGTEGETKPAISVTTIPDLIARRLRRRGRAVINLLPVPGVSWRNLTRQVAAPWPEARVVHLPEFENRIVVTGADVPAPRDLTSRLRRALGSIGSTMEAGLHVRAFRG